MDEMYRVWWKNWYREFRLSRSNGTFPDFAPGQYMSWEKFRLRRLRALDQYLKH